MLHEGGRLTRSPCASSKTTWQAIGRFKRALAWVKLEGDHIEKSKEAGTQSSSRSACVRVAISSWLQVLVEAMSQSPMGLYG